VPIIGIFIFFLETDFVGKIDFKNKKTLILIGGLIFLFSIITIVHSGNFSNKLSFWENAAKTSPNHPLAHRNLGAMQYLNKDMENAEKESKIALELNPEEQMAHNNLGLIYANQGKLKEAEEEYKKELENNPYYDNAYFNLGLLYWQEKKYSDAEINWKKTLEINPNYVDAYNALAIYYYQQKNYEEARPYINELYKRGIQLPPEFLQILQSK
ncbi:MAG: tetratricopeptide repeat protein, partial [Candidatus Paceibacterota bacterium]